MGTTIEVDGDVIEFTSVSLLRFLFVAGETTLKVNGRELARKRSAWSDELVGSFGSLRGAQRTVDVRIGVWGGYTLRVDGRPIATGFHILENMATVLLATFAVVACAVWFLFYLYIRAHNC